MKVYPDTGAGVMQFLRDESELEMAAYMFADRLQHRGVWRITARGKWRAVVYLKGYADQYGQIREVNDFEFEMIK